MVGEIEKGQTFALDETTPTKCVYVTIVEISRKNHTIVVDIRLFPLPFHPAKEEPGYEAMPRLAIWQGVVEISLRAGAVVSSIVAFVAAAVALGTLHSDTLDGNELTELSRGVFASSAVVVAIGVIGAVLGGLYLLIRILLLNYDTVNLENIQTFLASSIVVAVILAAGHFAGGVATAFYADDDGLKFAASFSDEVKSVRDSLAAAAAFCFISLPFYGLLVFWNILFLVKNCME